MIPIVINLKHRDDRLQFVKNIWNPIFKSIERFEAYQSNIRHKGSSLSHIYATLNFFNKNKFIDHVLVLEDDAIPLNNNIVSIINECVNINDTWEAIILSPLLSPGYLEIIKIDNLKNNSNNFIGSLKYGDNLSTAAVLYNRRIISYFYQLQKYYEIDQSKYIGIDRVMSSRKGTILFINEPIVQQNYTLKSDNPNAFSQSICNITQNASNIILKNYTNSRNTTNNYFNFLLGYFDLSSEKMDKFIFKSYVYLFVFVFIYILTNKIS